MCLCGGCDYGEWFWGCGFVEMEVRYVVVEYGGEGGVCWDVGYGRVWICWICWLLF